MERDYTRLIEKILQGDQLSRKEEIGLIVITFILHLRNTAYVNKTDKEFYTAYNQGVIDFFDQAIGEIHDHTLPVYQKRKLIAQNLAKYWNIRFLKVASEKRLITSDNPSTIFQIGNELAFVCLPVTPEFSLIVYDNLRIRVIENKLTNDDLERLNRIVACNSTELVFSSIPFDPKMQELYSLCFTKRRTQMQKGHIGKHEIKLALINYPLDPKLGDFSFIRIQ